MDSVATVTLNPTTAHVSHQENIPAPVGNELVHMAIEHMLTWTKEHYTEVPKLNRKNLLLLSRHS